MSKSIVIVESPAKAKTINRFLGSSFLVCSSMGHIRDLPNNRLGVDIENNFMPEYHVIPSRKETVNKLRQEVKKADEVYLAPDMDREGEAIAWHLCETLEIPMNKAHRVTFNEITRDIILKAFESPRSIDMNKVNAQQTRRILDRLVGYQISPILWKKISKGLSAGRVQSVAVKLIVEREEEIKGFKPKEYWRIIARLMPLTEKGKGCDFEAELQKINGENIEIKNEAQAVSITNELSKVDFSVAMITRREKKNNAPPPLTTSLLQQQASIRLRFNSKKTMLIAQQLYEGIEIGGEGSVGLITYMRTDSFNVSEKAIEGCRDLILKKFGKDYLPDKSNVFKSHKRSQAAHEAIRPTFPDRLPDELKPYLTNDQYKLYKLIWERFIASQMTPAKIAVTEVDIVASNYKLKAKGRTLIFDGHTILSGNIITKEEQTLPELNEGERLKLIKLTHSQHFTEPPPRYTEATLVKTLEKKGIGRPSTYAPIISTIQERGYVKLENRAFHATELGILVTKKLEKYFKKILDVEFTSKMEDSLDKIEDIGEDWVRVLKDFYNSFKIDLKKASVEMKSEKGIISDSERVCELCGSPMVIRWGRGGKFLGCSGFPKCKYTVSLDSNGEMLKVEATDQTCEKCGNPMVIRNGRNGRFLACSAYPRCKNTRSLEDNGDDRSLVKDERCEKCGSPMEVRFSKMGRFLGCSQYPRCKNAMPLPTGIKCPKEGCNGELVQRRSRKKRTPFFGCTNYPDCDYVTDKLPEPENIAIGKGNDIISESN